ncbi:hypothetical protein [Hymenobacter glacieicola]|uniref:DUF4369 domain-containing protein n=1 Tax=Hymenobacter glacieicola TaxID=1562124 RepID=A0ABQ1WWC4_9BACT|nr:hypothetical protein [Hymenobacter glacieicola]GGG47353.1 hypothetical protein GCM10011378_24440 [Hymenobacter glacieicola]
MRFQYFLFAALLISTSTSAQAQFDFEPGSYILENNAHVRHVGFLKVGNKNLRVKAEAGRILAYPWAEVRSYRIGNSRYVKASGFTIKTTLAERIADHEFVQLLDSGAVSLMRYEYEFNGGTPGFGGAPGLGPSRRPSIYLLQRAGETGTSDIPYNMLDGAGKKFREAVSSFVGSRPDLVKVVEAKKVTIYNLETFIHAFNNHEPFLNYPMEKAHNIK